MVLKTDYEGRVLDDGGTLELRVGSRKKEPGEPETYRFVRVSG